MNRYIRIQLIPLKQIQADTSRKYVIKIALRASNIHKVYSVRYRNLDKKYEDIFTYFIADDNMVGALSDRDIVYEYAHLIHQKVF